MIEDAGDEEPKWKQDYDSVVAAATRRKQAGSDMSMTSILDSAGVSEEDWHKAINKAKREIADEAREFYLNVLGRKMREPGGTRRASAKADDDAGDDDEATVEAAEENEEQISPAKILASLLEWIELLPTKAERTRALMTIATFHDIPVRFDVAAPEPQPRAKPGPKPGRRKGARA